MTRIFKKIYSKLQKNIELSRYNDFTIAGYFRKQGAQIGEENRIEIRDLGPEPYLIKIGNHCTIAPNVLFLVHDGATWVFTGDDPSLQKFAPIIIKDNCFIGMNSIIMGNVTIGPGSVVGAGSVVTKDVAPDTVVAGNPARVICTIGEYRDKVTRVWAEQKPPGYFKGLEKGGKYTPSYIHQVKHRDSRILREHLIRKFWGDKKS
ncbi:MAG: acyltransferase [Deltaproteobacteria bacterium]|nr:acyltransferase [Deltaproteobacteria bacterium]